MPNVLIVGHESELGRIAINHFESKGWDVFSTTRRESNVVKGKVFYCDLEDRSSIENATKEIFRFLEFLDLVVLSVGRLSPIGPIFKTNFDDWNESVVLNFVNQVYVIGQLLQELNSSRQRGTKFLTFAGNGTNSAPENYSSYTLSKIALLKSMELFAAEHPEHYFLSLGTGWMNSAIHNQTLEAGSLAGEGYEETLRRIRENDFGDPKLFCDFLDWYFSISNPKVSGRNIALQGDQWQSADFQSKLTSSHDSFKLRRSKDSKL
jgi:NAD(P)-dependent dehydrogenase (short-subunit alcohol dehydrogenase family)